MIIEEDQGELDNPEALEEVAQFEEEIDEEEEEIDEEEEKEAWRACSTSLQHIIREYLSVEVRGESIETMQHSIEQTTNYMADLSKQVFKIMLLFTECEFDYIDEKIVLVQQQGQSIIPVLPANYLTEDITVPNPLNPRCIQNDDLKKAFGNLFQEDYLNFIHSTYFGCIGIRASSLEKQPFHKAITEVLKRSNEVMYKDLSPLVMQEARFECLTNSSVIWSDNIVANKLLNNLIKTLLGIHLAPTRDREYKDKRDKQHQKEKSKQN